MTTHAPDSASDPSNKTPLPVTLREATSDAEREKVRPWLKQAFLGKIAPTIFVAESPEHPGEIVGAVSLRIFKIGEAQEARFLFFVKETLRRRGVGTELLRKAIEAAKEKGASSINAGVPLAESSAAATLLQKMGMQAAHTMDLYEISVEKAHLVSSEFFAKLKAAGKLPKGYEVIPLEKAKPDAIALFVQRNLGGFREMIQKRITGGENRYLPKVSVVIRSQEGPVAVLLASAGNGHVLVEARAIRPKMRKTWVNATLLTAFVTRVKAAGGEKIRFQIQDARHKETLGIVKRCEGELIKKDLLFGMVLA